MKLTFISAGLAAALLLSASATAQPAAPIVKTAYGQLAGVAKNGVNAYLGVPYARPPVGDLRWRPPAPPLPWQGVRDATHMGASCMQNTPAPWGPFTPEYLYGEAHSEDCLFLNIWVPAKHDQPLPVLLWIHGGGYSGGSNSLPIYDGARVAEQGVIFIGVNYRVDALGFMAHPELTAEQGGGSGNYGVQDPIEALRWIQKNIAAFGGDPTKVAIGGQSAGAGLTQALLAAPSAKGLFRAAVIESSPSLERHGDLTPLGVGEKSGQELLKKVGAGSIREARSLPAQTLLNAAVRGGPIADQVVLPKGTPSAFSGAANPSDVPIMIGYTTNDLFNSHRDVTAAEWAHELNVRYGALERTAARYYAGADSDAQATASANREGADRAYVLPLRAWAARRLNSSPVYAYEFDHVEPGPDAAKFGAFHTSEVPYLFKTLDRSPNRTFTAVDREVADRFSSYLVNFVKTCDPNGQGLPRWAPLSGAGEVMIVGDTPTPSWAIPAEQERVLTLGEPPALVPAVAPPPSIAAAPAR
jgi:para-nitrobenzyl esterase